MGVLPRHLILSIHVESRVADDFTKSRPDPCGYYETEAAGQHEACVGAKSVPEMAMLLPPSD